MSYWTRWALVKSGEWDESRHPREPAGSAAGGEFASGGGGGDTGGGHAAVLVRAAQVMDSVLNGSGEAEGLVDAISGVRGSLNAPGVQDTAYYAPLRAAERELAVIAGGSHTSPTLDSALSDVNYAIGAHAVGTGRVPSDIGSAYGTKERLQYEGRKAAGSSPYRAMGTAVETATAGSEFPAGSNRAKFADALHGHYERLFQTDPEYAASRERISPRDLAVKMTAGLATGRANIGGKGIKAAAKDMGLRPTYKALVPFLKD